MKKYYLLIFFLGFLFSQSIYAQQERITDFHVDIRLDSSGTIHISEQIQVYALRKQIKRGIYRSLPMSTNNKNKDNRKTFYKLKSVKQNGKKAKYHTRREGNYYNVYIGDKNIFLDEGEYSYEINYAVENQVRHYEKFDEIYWNATGTEWAFPIDQASANVHLPKGIEPLQAACYTGSKYSRESNCTIDSSQSTITFATSNLSAREGLTVAVGFTEGIIPESKENARSGFYTKQTFWEKYGYTIIASLIFLGLILYYIYTWRKHGVDPEKPTVYPQFNPPEGLSPASVGMLKKEYYWNDLLTTSIVNLAVKGYLKIEESTTEQFFGLFKATEFTLIKLKDADSELPKEEKVLFEELFEDRDVVDIDGKYKSFIADAVKKFKRSLNKQHSDLINEGNNYMFLVLPAIVLIGFFIFSFWYDDSIVAGNAAFILVAWIANMFFFLFTGAIIKAFSKRGWKIYLMMELAFLGGLLFFSWYFFFGGSFPLNGIVLASFFILSIVMFFAYFHYIKQPSVKKLKIQSLIEGFQMYLTSAEEKRIQHFNPPEMTPEEFEKMLPYAIAMDVEDVWGEKFDDYLSSTADKPQEYHSNWYSGHRSMSGGFTHALNASLANKLSTSASKPSSSSSGSSGGGFSGGGGGGGGGGGW